MMGGMAWVATKEPLSKYSETVVFVHWAGLLGAAWYEAKLWLKSEGIIITACTLPCERSFCAV